MSVVNEDTAAGNLRSIDGIPDQVDQNLL